MEYGSGKSLCGDKKTMKQLRKLFKKIYLYYGVTAPQRIAKIYRHLWGKTGQSAASQTVGYYGFTTIEGTKKRACISSPFPVFFRTFVEVP